MDRYIFSKHGQNDYMKRWSEGGSNASKQFHINCSKGDVGRYVLLPGDPGRCEIIASYFDNPVHKASNREFTTYTGTLSGVPVTVTSTGIGGPSAAIAVEELFAIGADTFIRVGTCGGINTKVQSGDCVIASAAIRFEGTSREYVPIEYPAVADFSIVSSLYEAATEKGLRSHVGVVQSKDSFYGQHAPERMPISYELLNKWESWKRLGVLASEMESAAVFTVASSLGARSGSILHTLWNVDRNDGKKDFDNSRMIETAVEAIKKLIVSDAKKGI